jgi:uncharacterized cupredoxin-like copper-binding protein
MNSKTIAAALLATAFGTLGLAASAHEGTAHHAKQSEAKNEQQPWGIAGDPGEVKRTIHIAMSDDMRFTPSALRIRQGETVRFVVANKGRMLHEMVIGTRQALEQHAALMQKFPHMQHDEPHMVHVAAGEQDDLVWRFNRAGRFDFACLIPGHYQAGMVGTIQVVAN